MEHGLAQKWIIIIEELTTTITGEIMVTIEEMITIVKTTVLAVIVKEVEASTVADMKEEDDIRGCCSIKF